MSRLKLEDTVLDAIVNLCDGNPGAVHVCSAIVKQTIEIDPDYILEGIGYLMCLDDDEIYGSDIYVLGSKCCSQSLPNMLAVLRAKQLGFYTIEQLKEAIQNQEPIDVEPLYKQVQEKLPGFNSGKPFETEVMA